MEKLFRVNGKFFTDENLAADYEKLIKKEQEESAKAKEKAEAERKAKEEAKEYRYNQVLDKLDHLNKVVESYEKETGEKLEFVTVNGKLTVQKAGYIGKYVGVPLFVDTHDSWWNRLFNELRGY